MPLGALHSDMSSAGIRYSLGGIIGCTCRFMSRRQPAKSCELSYLCGTGLPSAKRNPRGRAPSWSMLGHARHLDCEQGRIHCCWTTGCRPPKERQGHPVWPCPHSSTSGVRDPRTPFPNCLLQNDHPSLQVACQAILIRAEPMHACLQQLRYMT